LLNFRCSNDTSILHMPKVKIDDKSIECDKGTNLRKLLVTHNAHLYNQNSKYLNCRGIGTCGTCAVEVIGDVRPSKPGLLELKRISILNPENIPNFRLACYCYIESDVTVIKHNGFWGELNKDNETA
jgi:ferredoxin